MNVKYFHRSVDLLNSINKKITNNELIKKKDRVLLSISGGQDSICLMFLFNHLYVQMDLHLALFWCHHLWQFDSFSLMRQLAKLSFLFQFNGYFAISPKFLPSELLARHWRHNCNYRVCFFHNYYKIILAHSANDKVETIFLNLMRGTGLAGLFPLRWKQSVSKARIQNEEHISQFSTFRFSPFFWCTDSLDSFCCATSLKFFHHHTEYKKSRKDLPKIHSLFVSLLLFLYPSAYPNPYTPSGYWVGQQALRLYKVDLPLLDTSGLLPSASYLRLRYPTDPEGVRIHFSKGILCIASLHTQRVSKPNPEGVVVCPSGNYGCPWASYLQYEGLPLAKRGYAGKTCFTKTLLRFSPTDPLLRKPLYPLAKRGVMDIVSSASDRGNGGLLTAICCRYVKQAESKQKSAFSFSHISEGDFMENGKQKDPFILKIKKIKSIVFKKKSQQKLKFEHQSKKREKKIIAKKWFSYVSYTFLKVCL